MQLTHLLTLTQAFTRNCKAASITRTLINLQNSVVLNAFSTLLA
jgi:hypothetical protein